MTAWLDETKESWDNILRLVLRGVNRQLMLEEWVVGWCIVMCGGVAVDGKVRSEMLLIHKAGRLLMGGMEPKVVLCCRRLQDVSLIEKRKGLRKPRWQNLKPWLQKPNVEGHL